MTSLVVLKKEEPVVTSLSISEFLKIGHKSVIQLARQYEKDLNEFGTLAFEMRKSKGRPLEFCYLNEHQTYFLVTLMRNIKEVPKFKKTLIKEFMRMKKSLIDVQIRQNSENWKELRQQVKISRLETTDTIKRFVQYCTDAGSKKAFTYYGHLTNAEYKALFLLEQKYTNLRDLLTDRQLSMLKTADEIVIIALEEGMSKGIEYHEIYKMAKDRLEIFASIMPKTPVIMLNEIKQLGDGKQVVITKKGE